jgi:Rps23 Pro-64 3,4-dihydroxylase Tpa1-like proline 4-hydroxylase
VETLTGKSGLIPDPHLRGGGMHQIKPGGKLDIHADFNWHPRLSLNRSVNILVYLNKAWDSQWGGDLELWDKKMEKCVQKYSPIFNRTIIFNSTEDSFHGHPEPLKCPEGTTRKSIAFYLYESPLKENPQGHSTVYKKRPTDETTEEIEEFREKRSKFQTYASQK